MTAYRVKMIKSPSITEAERCKRLAQCYNFLLSLAAKSKGDVPASDPGEERAGASGGESVTDRHGSTLSAPAQTRARSVGRATQ